MRLTDTAAALMRQLAARADGRVEATGWQARPWASITFAGTRHRLTLFVAGREAAERMIDGLDYAEFELADGLVVDVALVKRTIEGDGERVTIEALVIDPN